jgi:hypothetical protein
VFILLFHLTSVKSENPLLSGSFGFEGMARLRRQTMQPQRKTGAALGFRCLQMVKV